jgi:hypothetical protein
MRRLVRKSTFSTTVVSLAVLLAIGAVGQDLSRQAPPPLDFKDCLVLSRRVLPNPFLPMANSFLLVTLYEEKPNEPGDITEDGEYLNVYLVHGYLQLPDRAVGIIYNTQLIVTRWEYRTEEATKTADQWVIADQNRDGLIDNGFFETVVQNPENRVLSEARIELPGKALKKLQSYYEKALHRIEQKAATESAKTCPIV